MDYIYIEFFRICILATVVSRITPTQRRLDIILNAVNGSGVYGKVSGSLTVSVWHYLLSKWGAHGRREEKFVFVASPSRLHHGDSGTFHPWGNQQHGVGSPGEIHASQTDRDRGVRLGVVSALSFNVRCNVCRIWGLINVSYTGCIPCVSGPTLSNTLQHTVNSGDTARQLV